MGPNTSPFRERKESQGLRSLLDAASGMRPDAFCFHVVEGKILEQKFPCVLSGWTTGLFGPFGMIFRPSGLAYLSGRYAIRGGADSGTVGIAQQVFGGVGGAGGVGSVGGVCSRLTGQKSHGTWGGACFCSN